MPRFYFHAQDGKLTPDREGVELADVEEARRHAIKLSGEILTREGARFWSGEDWQISALDSRGVHIFSLNFCGSPTSQIDDDHSLA